jgi:hypothetical protein
LAATSWNKKLDGRENGGSRTEVRRERKKRDNPSPAKVLYQTIYQEAVPKATLFFANF